MVTSALCLICAAEQPDPVICHTCTTKLRRDLDTIGKTRRLLDPTPGRGRTGRPTGKPGSRPPANLTVLALTDIRSRTRVDWDTGQRDPDDVDCVDADLLAEARILIETRRLATELRDVFDVIRLLNIHFDALTRSPRADETAAVLEVSAMALRRAAHDIPEPAVGRCTASHPQRVACGGPLRLAWEGDLPDSPDEQVAPTHIICGWCHDAWPLDSSTLVAMLRVVKPRAFPVTRQWAADTLGVRVKTITEWVRRGHVRAYADEQINLMDVIAKLADTPTLSSA